MESSAVIPKRSLENENENAIIGMPQKRLYRSRAHCNPLAQNDGFEYPVSYHLMDWKSYYPDIENPTVRIIDIGCGFGGLTIGLSTLYPDKLVLGMEIRAKVCEYVRLRIEALRRDDLEERERGRKRYRYYLEKMRCVCREREREKERDL
mmetsp:Transcript_30215/g.30701  ORF Transcript_30215/g.30701 Transcript_30215/m.30701 type:complete len:150 (+) Transcript_30215:142-591(+)